jgi:hypothetical protein
VTKCKQLIAAKSRGANSIALIHMLRDFAILMGLRRPFFPTAYKEVENLKGKMHL